MSNNRTVEKNRLHTKLSTKLILIYLIVFGFKICSAFKNDKSKNSKSVTFHFPEYAYKETSKNELAYREFESSCEHSVACNNQEGVDKVKCTRKCISNSCYQDIYAFDELEEGEIDVRLNSFKGCVIQRSSNAHRM